MCGIAGIIKLRAKAGESEKLCLTRMREALYHRGPDQSGEFHSPRVLLGSQRLKLLDLSDLGGQPMLSDDGSVILCFNGEISNYLELSDKYDLRKKYRFQTDSDTEVLLRLYQELGIGCLNELSGMFAFILYDRKKELVYVVRDFFGINPVFFTKTEEEIRVASELKSLVVTTPTLTIDEEAFHHLYTLAYIPGHKTPYQEVEELKAGHYLEINLEEGRIRNQRYYQLTFRPQKWNEGDAVKATREALVESVERHLRSDAPVGAMCSGGVDTSGLIGIVKHLGKASDFHTYSISIQDQHFNEERYQKIMTEYAGTEHHQVNVGLPEILENFETHLAFMDEPYGHGAALPTFLLAKEARKKVKALLSGEGGDELFNAYETHGAHFWKGHYLRLPSAARTALRKLASELPVSFEKLSLDFKLKRFLQGCELDLGPGHLYWRHVLRDDMKKDFLRKSFRPTHRLIDDLFAAQPTLDDFSKLSLWDVEYFFVGDLMVKNDRMSLANAVESRFPYMDRLVTDLVTTMPSSLKVKHGRRRHLQKEALKPFLPKAIYDRSGFGLELPYNRWFLGDLEPLYGKYFTKEYFSNLTFLNWESFEALLKLHRERRLDLGRFLWTTLIVCAWYDIHFLKRNHEELRRKHYLSFTA